MSVIKLLLLLFLFMLVICLAWNISEYFGCDGLYLLDPDDEEFYDKFEKTFGFKHPEQANIHNEHTELCL